MNEDWKLIEAQADLVIAEIERLKLKWELERVRNELEIAQYELKKIKEGV